MSKKGELEKAIRASEAEIELLEQKRLRSMCAYMEAIVNNKPLSAEDVEYFNTFTGLIELERENLRRLNYELEHLGKK